MKTQNLSLTILIIFLLILVPQLYTPIISDDFDYIQKIKGNWLHNIYIHYMTWSGRIFTDFTSTALLNLPHFVYRFINSLVFISLIFFIYYLPQNVLKIKLSHRRQVFVLVMIFILYWFNNPRLGESSFWLVGAANYLWTNFWILAFLNYSFYIQNIKTTTYSYILLFCLGVLAGASNESTCLLVFAITIFLSFPKLSAFLNINNYKIFQFSMLPVFIGVCILLLAPGNFQRLNNEHKIIEFVNVINYFFKQFERFFLLIPLLCVIAYLNNIYGKYKNLSIIALLFVIVGLTSVFMQVLSPSIQARALNGAFVFFLIATSFYLTNISYNFHTNVKNHLLKLCYFSLFVMVFSYSFFVYSYRQLMKQFIIQEQMILNAKANNKETLQLPAYFSPLLLRGKDKLAPYINDKIPSSYYDYNGKITSQDFYNGDYIFDYTIDDNFTKTNCLINQKITNDLTITKINSYSYSFPSRNSLTIFFNQTPNNQEYYQVELEITTSKNKDTFKASLSETIDFLNGYIVLAFDTKKIDIERMQTIHYKIIDNDGKMIIENMIKPKASCSFS